MFGNKSNNRINDAFSKCHPAVNFLFFAGAIILGVIIMHPAYLIAGILCPSIYCILLYGKKALKTLLFLLPFAFIIAFINPLFNHRGGNILFYLFGKPYTAEALLYGFAGAAVFVIMMLWLYAYGVVMTSDKFTALFGNLIPSVSLLLVMVLRMVPALIRKTGQIRDSRKSIGKGAAGESFKERLKDGISVLSSLTTFALEGSITTAQSMRSRGYGLGKRKSFMLYRMSLRDWLLLFLQFLLIGATSAAMVSGQAAAEFMPEISVAPLSFGIIFYIAYLCIPITLHIEEALKWRISVSKI